MRLLNNFIFSNSKIATPYKTFSKEVTYSWALDSPSPVKSCSEANIDLKLAWDHARLRGTLLCVRWLYSKISVTLVASYLNPIIPFKWRENPIYVQFTKVQKHLIWDIFIDFKHVSRLVNNVTYYFNSRNTAHIDEICSPRSMFS